MRNKKLFLILCVFFCLLLSSLTYGAQTGTPLLVDDADLLTDSQEADLSAELELISDRHGVDVVVVTVYSLEGKSSRDYADDYFDYNGYGRGDDRSGILLLHSPEYRDWWISTRGDCILYFTDAGLDYIGSSITDKLAAADYYGAYETFAELCDEFMSEYEADGRPVDADTLPREAPGLTYVLISLAVGLVVAFIIVSVMCSKHKSVRVRREADDYVRNGSMNLTVSSDSFLYRNVSRTPKPKNNGSSRGGSSSHRSSSGASHGGRGGKY